ncbi:DUF2642 domain-containing protein [Ureibacillus sp. 179-F W5.1 NHS]|uniref:DUF2642 domain-containing protein n=1 Tax=Lysinibacillus halotolerans TaxID=1368476 RepID=A0A3M8H5D9_9BACI|nr:DUF2642 domain-containing protein [Lysinibacillus halotolerans]RNC97645.1 DUF2642 domain-containing protein [Lysinibacillus halotolerans]
MWQLRSILSPLEGMTIDITTEFSTVSGILIEVKADYIVLRTTADLLYIPLASIKSVAY